MCTPFRRSVRRIAQTIWSLERWYPSIGGEQLIRRSRLKRFYRIVFDSSIADLGLLDEPRNSLGEQRFTWSFTEATRFDEPAELMVDFFHKGRVVAFNFSAFDFPVVVLDLAKRIEALAPSEVQLIPVTVEGIAGQYVILNVLGVADCVDEAASTYVAKWTEADHRPDKAGDYRAIGELMVDPTRIGDRKIFRVARWHIALVVDEQLKQLIENYPGNGVSFTTVN